MKGSPAIGPRRHWSIRQGTFTVYGNSIYQHMSADVAIQGIDPDKNNHHLTRSRVAKKGFPIFRVGKVRYRKKNKCEGSPIQGLSEARRGKAV